ncbi:tail assembly protein [Salmonella enterica subsp. enterica]|nr:tail assembly protein [Salmonella enterica subsp. enterica]
MSPKRIDTPGHAMGNKQLRAGVEVDRNGRALAYHVCEDDWPLPAGAVMHIVPRLAGAKSGWAGVLLGAALIGASFIPGLNALAATVLFSSGASMALGGVAQMLAPQAKSSAMHSADNGRQNTYFSSLENMVAQGNPVPLAYGEVMTGSRRISQEITTRDESSPDKVVVFGRRTPDKTGDMAASGIAASRVIMR